MRKANTVATLASNTTTVVPDDAVQVATLFCSREKRDIEQRISSLENDIDYYREERDNYQYRLETAEEELSEYESELHDIDTCDIEQSARTSLERIAKFPFIDSVVTEGDSLNITTKLLFTDIQRTVESRERIRRCIGAFSIILTNSGSVYIRNLLFTEVNHPHWSIGSAGNPCYGDWQNDINSLYRANDIAGLVLLLKPYLESTDDGSAYLRSAEWIEERDIKVTRKSLRKGTYVMARTFQGANVEPNDKGIVTATDDVYIYVAYDRQNPDGVSSENPATLYVHRNDVVPLKKKDYLREDATLDNIELPQPHKKIDALPDGSTLADAKALL